MQDWFEDDYQDYLVSYRAWGHRYVPGPLGFDDWCDLREESELIDDQEDCEILTKEQRTRRDQIQRQLLEHESFFEDGPRVVITLPSHNDS